MGRVWVLRVPQRYLPQALECHCCKPGRGPGNPTRNRVLKSHSEDKRSRMRLHGLCELSMTGTLALHVMAYMPTKNAALILAVGLSVKHGPT